MTINVLVPVVVALIAGLAAGLSPYLIARRSGSGRIETSDAATVFDAATKYMTRLADDNQALRERLDVLEQRESECVKRVGELQRELETLRAEVGEVRDSASS